jgi:excisionase family DNA binding protein
MNSRLWTVAEVAEFLGLSAGSIYHMLSEKRLPFIRISARCERFDPDMVMKWAAERAEKPK